MLLAIGCYTTKMGHVSGSPGKGISIVDLDLQTGALREVSVEGGIRNPSYLALSPDGRLLYAPEELGVKDAQELFTYALDQKTGRLGLLSRVAAPGGNACHVSVDPEGRYVFLTNFITGDLLCYRLTADGMPQDGPQVVRTAPPPASEASRMHCSLVLPGAKELLACDAGRDVVATFAITASGLSPVPVSSLSTPQGSFPRHIALTASGKAVLLATELSVHLQILGVGTDGLTPGTSLSALPAAASGKSSGAAVRVHPNGRFGYMSVRGDDSIFGAAIDAAALTLSPIGNWSTRGRTPRDFAITPDGRWLVAANQDSDSLNVAAIDQQSGALTPVGEPFTTGSPVCVRPFGS